MQFTVAEIAELHSIVASYITAQELEGPRALFIQLRSIMRKLEMAEKWATDRRLEKVKPDLDSSSYVLISQTLARTHIHLIQRVRQAMIELAAAEHFASED